MAELEAELVYTVLDLGEEMLRSGGEVTRVEDTICRILSAYGFKKVDVFTITSLIEIFAITKNNSMIVQTRRVHNYATDLEKLAKLNGLSRKISNMPPSLNELQKDLESIVKPVKEKRYISYLGAIMAAGGFTVFFGGTLYDACTTGILACIINYIDRRGIYKKANQLLFYLLCSLATGAVGNILVESGVGVHLDKILIGCIMLTIPGIAITYSVRDMLLGETITGLLRFVESLLIAASIAGGYILSTFLMGELI